MKSVESMVAAIGAALLLAAVTAAAGTGAGAPGPVRLALFDFELEDFSAGSGTAAQDPSDQAHLAAATAEVRRLLEQSGRYSLVDVGGADAQPAKSHALRWCGGCEAPIALKLGADQALVGVITRISRTEYTVQVQIRDARTGAVVFTKLSGLRMGANYSWSRGASSLVRNDLLAGKDAPPDSR